jgi:diadenosine tetraphosphate (Ap4A) HIT family hydrolase
MRPGGVPDCLVCRELAGDLPLPGGLLWDDGLAAAFHVPPLPDRGDPYLGHLLVVTRRHAAGLADLSDEEGASVGRLAARLSRALVLTGGATWVHAGVVGLHVPHFHLHLVPRYADTPEDVAWHEVDEWDGARHGTAEEISELAVRLRIQP